MQIKSLEKMEEIVKKNNSLFWDGWTVVVELDQDGYYSQDGVFNQGKWVTHKRFELNGDGV